MVTPTERSRVPRSHGLVRAIADGAIPAADELLEEAVQLESKAGECRRLSGALRELWLVATRAEGEDQPEDTAGWQPHEDGVQRLPHRVLR